MRMRKSLLLASMVVAALAEAAKPAEATPAPAPMPTEAKDEKKPKKGGC